MYWNPSGSTWVEIGANLFKLCKLCTRRCACLCKEEHFSPRLTHLWHLWPCSQKKFYLRPICEIYLLLLLHQSCSRYDRSICCIISIMDVRLVNPPHLFPKTIIRAEGFVVMSSPTDDEPSFTFCQKYSAHSIDILPSFCPSQTIQYSPYFLSFLFLDRFLFLPGRPVSESTLFSDL